MYFPNLPLTALAPWGALNNVQFLDTTVAESKEHKGQHGIVITRTLSSVDIHDMPRLLDVPKELVLDREFLLRMEILDPHFKQLKELIGGKSFRGDVMLFLLLQVTIARNNTIICKNCFDHKMPCFGPERNDSAKCENCVTLHQECIVSTIASHSGKNMNVGVHNPWSDYVKFLPEQVPVPTRWTEEERGLLRGTTLEHSVSEKMQQLTKEFANLVEKTIEIPWCHSCWWDENGKLEPLFFNDWCLLDAWYRSRSLGLKNEEAVMVPCLDMANHSFQSNAYWEQISGSDVSLVLRDDVQLAKGSEISIDYAGNSKGDAEMLFAYGFVQTDSDFASLRLNVEPKETDPLGRAKLAAWPERPSLRLFSTEPNQVSWECPFLSLMCLNEEDGLEFKTSQEVDGEHTSLKVFWQETDVTDSVKDFERLISGHNLVEIFKLRAVAILSDIIRHQIESLIESEEPAMLELATDERIQARALREIEMDVLITAFSNISAELLRLQELPSVCEYLSLMQSNNEETPDIIRINREEDN